MYRGKMSLAEKTNLVRWCSPGANLDRSVDVSSHGDLLYRICSPFSHNDSYRIPVPGNESTRSDSVEGIWQGLKMINGGTDVTLFNGKPRKRNGKVEGHSFGSEVLDYLDARKRIYLPAYIYHVVNNTIPKIKDDLVEKIETGPVYLYDVEANGDIYDITKPLSHASILATILNLLLEAPLPPFSKERFSCLSDQLEAALSYRKTLDGLGKPFFDEIVTFAYLFSGDPLRETFALEAIATGDFNAKDRLKNYTPSKKTRAPYSKLLRL